MQCLAYLRGRLVAKAAVEAIAKGLQQPCKTNAARTFAAVPDFAVRSDIEDEDQEAIPAGSQNLILESVTQSRQQRREEWRSLTTQQILERLKSQLAASAPGPAPKESEQATSDWRTVLAAASQLQNDIDADGEYMLTDTFG